MAYATTNPYTGEVVKEFPTATAQEVEQAITRAHDTFTQWSRKPVAERVEVLARAADILEAKKREYAEIITLEMGKLIAEAEAEIDICVDMLRYYVANGEAQLAPRYLPAKGFGEHDVQLINEPLGVLYAVEPWNFPYYQVIRIGAPQFTAGNTIVLKHASNVPQSALKMVELFREAGAPDGLLVNIFAGHNATETILSDPRVRGVALTGSEGAGAAVSATASKYLKKSTLELGGADAFIVLSDAELDKAVDWAVFGRHWNAGQVCCSSKRIIVEDSLYDAFLAQYTQKVAALTAGDPMDPNTQLAPLSSQTAADELGKLVDKARAEGATVTEVGIDLPEHGAFYQPTILTDIPLDSDTAHSEFFGPVSQIYRARDIDHAVEIANSSPFGLGGSVFSQDEAKAKDIARRLDTGMVYINQPTGVKADIPFGGTKRSGFGRELIDLGLHEFVNQKVVVVTDIDGSF
ncbi:NAD-dependent succinate-semialdehyde dehydrogenase [Corynebacterium belfantii]|uniref:NAD-dependent succinate-semialdehyde dehydrogenase n=1 Tax=Corynebacterium belfantii TaxID=2014537 RepID=A0ABS0LH96_9CORY|nr:NAD-dependent succinate-semialdehyde dehydrogenase [Corynebacterium belfantii]QVI99399.1 NAD-dependent succinate-semialdehyde dehydrogenase [Corynebacterium diphtheriae]MBG9288786.1 NAD-dependent succinate-semialdehyde dehydrogenase [Corynebacterium belfantii]MBG9311391.1 NAD-dependent succinate-semialdehyde dehydrogenase [Corynebacterium belfantii]MBG9348162.1 NAD-dependent succinate-semialdehyde dehydrogenase [Corynebacterium belfantii]MBG9355427.1 NAD-dependent succinate-semialdehyde deh